MDSAAEPPADCPVAKCGPVCSLPAFLSLPLSPAPLCLPWWSGSGDGGNLVLSCFCPNSIWGPSPPSSLAIHVGFLSSFLPCPPWLTGCPFPTWPGLFLYLCLHRLILGIRGFGAFVWAAGLSLCLCLSPTTLPSFSLISRTSFVGHSLLSPFDLLSPLCRGRMKGSANCSSGAVVPGAPSQRPPTRAEQEGKRGQPSSHRPPLLHIFLPVGFSPQFSPGEIRQH